MTSTTTEKLRGIKPVTYICPTCGLKQTYSDTGRLDFLLCDGAHCEADCSTVIEAAWRKRVASRGKAARAEAVWADRGDDHAVKEFARLEATYQDARRNLENVRDFILYGLGGI